MTAIIEAAPAARALAPHRPLVNRARRRPGRWWRWLAASAIVHPGGAMALHLLDLSDDGARRPATRR
jgi:hypothetical protein